VKDLGVTGHGPAWLISIFEKLGDNPDDASYIKPAPSDVWAFVSQVKSWLVNSNRKGIPA
jgi:hypothetical protein